MNPLKLSPLQEQMIKEITIVKNFYSKDTNRRAVCADGSCSYMTQEGDKCAIGRLLNKKDLEYLECNDLLDGNSIEYIYPDLTTKRVKDLSVIFWDAVQGFHDGEANWNDKGITGEGIRAFHDIIKQIKDGEFN